MHRFLAFLARAAIAIRPTATETACVPYACHIPGLPDLVAQPVGTIEENFLDDKSGGFQVQTNELTTPEALERLFLILAIATLYCMSIGVGVVRAQVRRWVDTHWDRGLSYFKIGWRWLSQQYRNGWQAFRAFWLDPAPDPEPAMASRRQAALPKRQWQVVLQC